MVEWIGSQPIIVDGSPPRSAAENPPGPQPDTLAAVRAELRTLVLACGNSEELLQKLADWLGSLSELQMVCKLEPAAVQAALAAENKPADSPAPQPGEADLKPLVLLQRSPLTNSELARAGELAGRAIDRSQTLVSGLESRPGSGVIATPCRWGQRNAAVVAVTELRHPTASYCELFVELAIQIESWVALRQAEHEAQRAQQATVLVDILATLQKSSGLQAAVDRLSRLSCDAFRASAAVASWTESSGTRWMACAAGGKQDTATPLEQATHQPMIHAAIDECMTHDGPGHWSAESTEPAPGTKAQQKLAAALQMNRVSSVPLTDSQGAVRGAWMLFECESAEPLRRQFQIAAAGPISATVDLLDQRHESLWAMAVSGLRRIVAQRKTAWIALAVAVVLGGLATPVTYRIDCDCVLEPVMRRYVAAPFEAQLEISHVRPGDLVSAGQELAALDGRELRWELSGIDADLKRAEKERSTKLAAQDFAAAQNARLEADRLRSRRELFEHRVRALVLRSPMDGIVISGDLEKSQGVRFSLGDPLYEIAPLDEMIVEIAVAESDLRFVTEQSEVEVRIDAFPDQKWNGTVERIHPRSEIRDGENVFVAEVRFANPDGLLRPGMQGRAVVEGPTRSLGWKLFHRPVEEVRLRMGW